MKKILLLFAAVLMASTQILAQSVGDIFINGDLRYKITSISPNTVEVTTASSVATQHYPLTAGTTTVTIPEYATYNGQMYAVTKIAGGSTPADAPSNAAFYKSGIETIRFAPNAQVTEIGDYAFTNSSTATVTLPEGLTTIGRSAFNGCRALQAITIPASVTSIGQYAFSQCAVLADVTVSWTDAASIPTPGNGAFSGIATGAVLHAPLGTKALYEAKGWDQGFTIDAPTPANNQIIYQSSDHQVVTPNSTYYFDVTMTDNTYDAEADLGTITFSGDLTAIGDYAFMNCSTLTTIIWPSTVTGIGESAFQNCTNLSSIDLQEGVTSIGRDAFNGCAGAAELTIPSTVTTIGNWAFDGLQNLTKLTVKAGSIGESAFQNCTNLSSIDLQEGVTSIGKDAFNGCAGMSELTIPSTVTSIGGYAFAGWQNLTKLTVKAGSIGESAFQGCTNLSSIDLQEGVTSIGKNAFHSCTGLKELILPSTVTSIGYFAFNSCKNLTKLTIKGGSIGQQAFNGCTNLSSIDLQEGVTSIGKQAFEGCAGMTAVTIPSTVTSIGNWAFNGLQNLTKLTVKAGEIGYNAFEDCTNLSSINLQEGVTSIGDYAFKGCTGLTYATIKADSIRESAFQDCTNVKFVQFLGVVKLTDIFKGIGTAENPAILILPAAWPENDKPVNCATPWHGGYFFNSIYINPTAADILGAMAEPCEECPAVTISNGETTVKLYNPTSVSFEKQSASAED